MPDADVTHALYQEFEARLSSRHARMREVSDVYNGRTNLPLPEIGKSEQAAVPNLCRQGTDQLARRVASVIPNQTWPATRPNIETSRKNADLRRQVAYGWWEQSKIRQMLARRARWFITYASAPAVVRPDTTMGIPRWEPVSPFDVFPAPTHIGSNTPDEVILRHKRTLRWLEENYPDAAAAVKKGHEPRPTDEFMCLEHITPDYVCYTVIGKEAADYQVNHGTENAVKLFEMPNRAECCWVVIPEQVSLDAAVGQFDDILGMYQTQAAMMALQIIAARKAIWPETWLVNPNGPTIPHPVQTPDPKTGTPGVLTNGILDRAQIDPGFRGQEVIDRLEYSQRQTAGLPAELGGSGSQNVRTGRRGSQIMSASIDFTIAEAQDALAMALHDENIRAARIDKGYFNYKKSFYVSTKGVRGKVEYKPSDLWDDSVEHIVEYPIAGSDLSDLVINGGQRVGMGTMSKRSFMDIDPLVSDAELEESRVRFEGIDQAAFAALQNLVSMPEGPLQLHHVMEIRRRVREGEDYGDVYLEVHNEIKALQAEGAPAGSPETQSGLGMPGQGSEIPAIPGLGPGAEEMTGLLSQLGVADMAIGAR